MAEQKVHPLTEASMRLAEISVAMRELYIDRDHWTDRILAVSKYGAKIAEGKEVLWAGFSIKGNILKPEKVTPTERRQLHRLLSGNYLKITVRRVTS